MYHNIVISTGGWSKTFSTASHLVICEGYKSCNAKAKPTTGMVFSYGTRFNLYRCLIPMQVMTFQQLPLTLQQKNNGGAYQPICLATTHNSEA